ncbi:MAG: ExeM/NucH family extracellular endonuclease, partial [Anaerolineae bacterium]|nr:ExeM/NucH family extracellular endonuclease [Anaerolineae bacterium]
DDATATIDVEDDDAAIVYTKIHEIQGSGTASPLVGQTVTIQGIVVGDYDESGEMGGFFVQEETTDEDGNAATSEGIFVFCGSSCSTTSIGNLVTVQGTVTEFNGLTELGNVSSITVNDSSNQLSSITPAVISFPQSSTSDLEAYEGMFVQISTDMRVTEYFNFDRFSEIRVWNDGSGAERPMQYTQVNTPDATGYAQAEVDFAAASVLLDDGSNSQNVGKVFPQSSGVPIFGNASFNPGTPDGGFRGGDIIRNIEGVMGYSFNAYRIYISDPSAGTATDGDAFDLTVSSENPRPSAPNPGGSLRVASFNVLNFFTTLDNGSDICGPAQNQECRGADNSTEYDRQLTKIVNALAELDADIVGLIELENNVAASPAGDGTDPVLEALVTALNAQSGRTYSFVDAGVIGTDAIKVAFIYDVNTVNLVSDPATLTSAVDSRFIDTKNRPALAQTFEEAATGGVFTVVVNHLKSKGSACDDVSDPDLDDGAGNCNLTRTAAAQALVDWLATDPTSSGDEDFLIIGDLNSYAMEDPIMAIRAGS